MDAETALGRFARKVSEINAKQGLLEIQSVGGSLLFRSGTQSIKHRRLLAQAAGVIGVVAGVALAYITLWAWLLVVFGVTMVVLTPRWICQQDLLHLNVDQDLFLVRGNGVEAVQLPLSHILHVHGTYESAGWDPYSRVCVTLREGSEFPVLLFQGMDAPVTEYACQILGYLLNCPASCTDPFGSSKSCYVPTVEKASSVPAQNHCTVP